MGGIRGNSRNGVVRRHGSIGIMGYGGVGVCNDRKMTNFFGFLDSFLFFNTQLNGKRKKKIFSLKDGHWEVLGPRGPRGPPWIREPNLACFLIQGDWPMMFPRQKI